MKDPWQPSSAWCWPDGCARRLLPEGDLPGELLELQVLARTGELDAYRPPLYLGFPLRNTLRP